MHSGLSDVEIALGSSHERLCVTRACASRSLVAVEIAQKRIAFAVAPLATWEALRQAHNRSAIVCSRVRRNAWAAVVVKRGPKGGARLWHVEPVEPPTACSSILHGLRRAGT